MSADPDERFNEICPSLDEQLQEAQETIADYRAALCEMQDQRDDALALVAEIRSTYKPTPEGHSAPSVISVVSPERYARWSERAERNAGAPGSQPDGDGPGARGEGDGTPEAAEAALVPPADAEPGTGDWHTDLLESAWGVIANAGWNEDAKSPGWQEAAVRWRNDYHRWLRMHLTPSGWRTWEEVAQSLVRERDGLIAENVRLRQAATDARTAKPLAADGGTL